MPVRERVEALGKRSREMKTKKEGKIPEAGPGPCSAGFRKKKEKKKKKAERSVSDSPDAREREGTLDG